jgi:hypothetical protein
LAKGLGIVPRHLDEDALTQTIKTDLVERRNTRHRSDCGYPIGQSAGNRQCVRSTRGPADHREVVQSKMIG